MREALQDTLPPKIYNRFDKMGFATPEEVWVRNGFPEQIKRLAALSVERSHGILTAKGLEHLNDVIAGRERFSHWIWRVVIFGEWLAMFDVGFD